MLRVTIEERLGIGSQGEVYAARLPTGERIALKRLGEWHQEEDRARLAAEARWARRARHSDIIKPIGLAEMGGEVVLLCELAPGRDLATLARYQPPPVAATLSIGAQVADMLHALSVVADDTGRVRGVVHRDLHAGNVIIDGRGTARLIDLGLGALARGLAERTASGQQVGAVSIMAPEALMHRSPTPAQDVFSLGAMLVDLLGSGPIYRGRTSRQVAALASDPEAFTAQMRAAIDGLPAASLLAQMLAHDPRDRPPARRVATTLRALVEPQSSVLEAWSSAAQDLSPNLGSGAWSQRTLEGRWISHGPHPPDAFDNRLLPRATTALAVLLFALACGLALGCGVLTGLAAMGDGLG
jgi:serine/threonine protein kinase